MAFASSNDAALDAPRELQLVLEAARRANWDAKHGPASLRAGRFVSLDLPPEQGYQDSAQGNRPTSA
jgi:hypothetical protein